MSNKTKVLLAAALAVGLLILALQREQPAGHASAPVAQKDLPALIAVSASAPTAVAASKPSAAAAVVNVPIGTARLTRQYNEISQGRPFILDAWARPAEGGRFYASRVVDHCHGLEITGDLDRPQPDIAAVGEADYLQASAALQRLQARCGQLTSEDHATYAGRKLLGATDHGSDVLVAASHEFSKALSSGIDDRKTAVRRILELRDPLLLDDVGMRLSLYGGSDGSYLYFDGTKYFVRNDPSIAAAYYLLPCGLGLDCGNADPELAMRCVVGTGCYSSRFDLVRAEMAGGSEQKNEKILSMYRALVSAVQAGEVHRFVP